MTTTAPERTGIPHISVIIPARRFTPELADCLRSLQAQRLAAEHYEVLLAGDLPDENPAGLTETAGLRLRVLRGADMAGCGRALTAAVQAAAGRIVLFLPPDAVADPACLLLHVRAHDSVPDEQFGVFGRVDAVCGPQDTVWCHMLARWNAVQRGGPFETGRLYGAQGVSAVNFSLPRRTLLAALPLSGDSAGAAAGALAAHLESLPAGVVYLDGCRIRRRQNGGARDFVQGAAGDDVRPFLRQEHFSTADRAYWAKPPARLLRAVEEMTAVLEGLERQICPLPSFAHMLSQQAVSCHAEGLAALRTRDVLALLENARTGLDAFVLNVGGACGTGRNVSADWFSAMYLLRRLHEVMHLSACGALAESGDSAAAPAMQTAQQGRILLACNYFWPMVGGTEVVVEELGEQFVAAGYAVDVACRHMDTRPALTHKGMRIIPLHCWKGFRDDMGPDAPAYRTLVMQGGYDAVIALAHPDSWVCCLLRGLPSKGRPRIIMMPSMNADNLRTWRQQNEMDSIHDVLRAADRHVSVSERGVDAEVLDGLGLTHTFIPHAVDTRRADINMRQRLGLDEDVPLAVCVGNFWPVKNQLELLRTMTAAQGSWQLVLAGGPAPWPSLREYFMQCCAAAERDPRVRMTGTLSREEAAALIYEADVLLLPSLGESAGPLVVLQAMAMGTPWIATPQCNSVQDEAGGLIVPLDSFPAAMQALLRGPHKARLLAALGREHWQRCFTWARSFPVFMDLVQGREPAADLSMPAGLRSRWQEVAQQIVPLQTCDGSPGLHDCGQTADICSCAVGGGARDFLFSVVTAAYNCEPWLDACIASLASQSLGFEEHIQLVLVDDGSQDGTAAVAGRWAARYPDNILVLRTENGGVAAARNTGLPHARGRWVTFIDADDCVSENYFAAVREALKNNEDGLAAVSCRPVYLFDDNTLHDTHPLRYKYARSAAVVNLQKQPEYIQLAVNAVFLDRQRLVQSGVLFDSRVRPSFEDAHFLNRYFLHTGMSTVCFLRDAVYFYRKRGTQDSLVDSGWKRPEKYRDQIVFGYLDLLRAYAAKTGTVPEFIQNTVFYDVYWYFRKMLDSTLEYAFSDGEAAQMFGLLRTAFRFVDVQTMLHSPLPMIPLFERLVMLHALKSLDLSSFPLVVQEVAADRGAFAVSCYGGASAVISAVSAETAGQGAGRTLEPAWSAVIRYACGGEDMLVEKRVWFRPEHGRKLRFTVNGNPVQVLCGGQLSDEVSAASVAAARYLPLSAMPEPLRARYDRACAGAQEYAGCWLLMDRVHKADDNAEHFYFWLREHAPHIPVYFVLSRRCADWTRLAHAGVRLLAYGSEAHFSALAGAAWLVSSQVDPPVVDPLEVRENFGVPAYKVAFLQHGIITQDLSRWLNKKQLDLFVTSCRREYDSIVEGDYKFTPREVVLTGLPRHDTLLHRARQRRPGRVVLFCPTWRMHLRQTADLTSPLTPEEGRIFTASCYFRAWNAVTGSRRLERLAAEHRYRFIFLPHPEVSRYLPLFEKTEAFTFMSYADLASVQDILLSSRMLVTDYSSLAAEAAFLGRSLLYYHFPEKRSIFSGHVYTKGYFDYARDGFGPQADSFEMLAHELETAIHRGCVRTAEYEKRAGEFFTLRDGGSCRRVFDAITARS
ncbi:CDP-glycerol:poly(glycerophosphate) glycerophosphotransferase [Oleidesulfovibrio alaskensis G20]|uniref:CDP-glycerol:poly(Glycerophosphate) glycerophosphotransferase n=3 Tax=Oleidesulfovibrio alaskensis TaxID=58180 RepID=Q316B4_OLEA2|nr:CDP-glycerol:poly(glycerophosphate) glycerophosphotransferase [Oleidesulfovibrio alaskensis G20]